MRDIREKSALAASGTLTEKLGIECTVPVLLLGGSANTRYWPARWRICCGRQDASGHQPVPAGDAQRHELPAPSFVHRRNTFGGGRKVLSPRPLCRCPRHRRAACGRRTWPRTPVRPRSPALRRAGRSCRWRGPGCSPMRRNSAVGNLPLNRAGVQIDGGQLRPRRPDG